MKKVLAIVLSLALLTVLLTGCGQSAQPSSAAPAPTELPAESSQAEPTAPPEESAEPSELESAPDETSTEAAATEPASGSIVYMTTDISPEGMMAVYHALGWTPTGKVAIKLSTGEPPASNYLQPELIADVVKEVNGTIVECNTAYGGSRSGTAMHYQVAEDHGFTAIADFQILDEDGSMTLPVTGGSRLTENYVGAAFADYDSYLVLSHSKGHSVKDSRIRGAPKKCIKKQSCQNTVFSGYSIKI